MMDYYQGCLSCFGRKATMTPPQQTRLTTAIAAYRRARERYEIALFERDEIAEPDPVAHDQYWEARSALNQVRADIVLELAQTLAEELRNA